MMVVYIIQWILLYIAFLLFKLSRWTKKETRDYNNIEDIKNKLINEIVMMETYWEKKTKTWLYKKKYIDKLHALHVLSVNNPVMRNQFSKRIHRYWELRLWGSI